VKGIRIYVEGGGKDNETKAAVRNGFDLFFRTLKDLARKKSLEWRVVACGSRSEAFRAFCRDLKHYPETFNVLLVDSEGPISARANPWNYLASRDHWKQPDATNDQCHLMVQFMESWFVADLTALSQFYGHHFNARALPHNANIEAIAKKDVERSLKQATKNTSKGGYHKIRHGAEILGMIDAQRVRAASRFCDRLFRTVESQIQAM